MIRSSYILLLALCATSGHFSFAQVPTQCLEIESILVDACISFDDCPGSQESDNEMVRFRVGPDPIDVNDLTITWPNNPWQGFAQDANTATLVATLNATIQACGWLIEPTGGILPPGAAVILVTSTQMCTAANSFTALGDTLHILFQNAGNSSGHFVNHNNGFDTIPEPIGASSLRTLIITHTPSACADTVTYDRSQLVNIYGNYGGSGAENDGATVQFTWPGQPQLTYLNFGCQAPFEPVQVGIGPVVGSLCSGGSVQLSAAATGGYAELFWQGGEGVFSDPEAMETTYTAGAGESGDVLLSFCAVGTCGDTICAEITLVAGELPEVIISTDGPTEICSGQQIQLIATGNGTHVWSTTEVGDTITILDPGSYSVTSTNACGTATASITIGTSAGPQITIDGETGICAGGSTILTASGADEYEWNDGTLGPIILVTDPGIYTVIGTNSCGSGEATVEVLAQDPPSADIDGPSIFCTGQSIELMATGGDTFLWSTGENSEEITVTEAGTYQVVAYNICGSDTASVVVDETSVQADFDADVTEGEAPLSVIFLDLSIPDDVDHAWNMGDGTSYSEASPVHMFDMPGEYLVTLIVSAMGCSDTATMVIIVNGDDPPTPIEGESSVEVPNVFTPNGDGQNDIFELTTNAISEIQMSIYNRWGQMVYEIKYPRQAWDGRSFAGQIAPEGTYFYELRAQGDDGRSHEFRGTVTLLR